MREWEPWQLPEYAESRLEMWGNPTSPPKTWFKYKYNNLKKLPEMIDGDSVLDVGCGCGHTYAILKGHVKEYLGVDSAKAMIDICHRFFPERLFKVGDVYDLSPFKAYDTVISTQVLIHIPDLEEPLKQLWRHANKTLIFTLRPPKNTSHLRKWRPDPLEPESDYYLIGHNYKSETVIDAINNLEHKESVKAYTVEGAKNVMYIKIVRSKNKYNKNYTTSIFNKVSRWNRR